MALLLYDGLTRDPRIARLDDEASWVWLRLISACARNNTDTLTLDQATDVLTDRFIMRAFDQLEAAELLTRDGQSYILRARGDLWEIET